MTETTHLQCGQSNLNMVLGWKTKSNQNLINKSPQNQTVTRYGHHLGPVWNKGITTCSLAEALVHSQGPESSHVQETRKIRGKLDKIKIIGESTKPYKINCQMECGSAIWPSWGFLWKWLQEIFLQMAINILAQIFPGEREILGGGRGVISVTQRLCLEQSKNSIHIR